MNRVLKLLLIGLLLTILAGGVAFISVRSTRNLNPASDVPVELVRRQDFVRRVYADGNLEAVQATPLSPPAGARSAMRISWLAPNCSEVSEGDVVVRFDGSELEETLYNGRCDRATTDSRIAQKTIREESKLRNLERDADSAMLQLDYVRRYQSINPDLFSRMEIISSQIDSELAGMRKTHADEVRSIQNELFEVELDLLSIERRKAQLDIEKTEAHLKEMEIVAPHDGLFVLKDQWGDLPQVGSMVYPFNEVAEIPQLDTMQAKIYVLEADAGGLEVGQPATVVVDARPGRSFRATVKQVEALAQRRNRRVPVQYFGVVLELESTDPEIMKPGQRVQAELVLAELAAAVTVPRQAVFEVEGANVVYVRRGVEFEPVEVSLGFHTLGRVVIEDGLDEGVEVALRDPTIPLSTPEASEENNGSGTVVGGAL